MIVVITLVFGLGGFFVQMGDFQLQGIALSAFIAIVLNILLPREKA